MTQTSTQTHCTGFVPEASDDPLCHGPAHGRIVFGSGYPTPVEYCQSTDGLGDLRQGNLESCNPNCFADAILYLLVTRGFATGAEDRPSRLFLYREALLRGGWKDGETPHGVAFSWLVDTLNSAGFPREALWPYDPDAFAAGNTTPPLASFRDAYDQRNAIRMHPVPRSVEATKAHLLGKLPLVCGVETKILDPNAGGSHAIRPIGWKLVDGVERVMIRNPWGPEFDTTISWDELLGAHGIWAFDLVRTYS